MRYLRVGALVTLLGAGVAAQTPNPDVMTPIQKFIDAFNKGDMAGAAATHAATPDLVIVDEVPPFLWRGERAFDAWATALDSESKKAGLTDQAVAISAPTRTEIAGDAAYVIVPAVYSYKQGGAGMSERSQMTFVLKKGTDGWLIHGWTWTGPKPTASSGGK